MKRKAMLSIILGAITLVSVGCTNVEKSKVDSVTGNKNIVENKDTDKKAEVENKTSEEMVSSEKPTNKEDKRVKKEEIKKENAIKVENLDKNVDNSKGDSKEKKESTKKVINNKSNSDNNQIKYSNEKAKESDSSKKATPEVVNKPEPVSNSGEYMQSVESEIIRIVNVERAKAGKKALAYNGTMTTYGRNKSKDMAVNNYFSHQDKSNRTEYDKMKANGVNLNAWGENIAYVSTRSPEVLARDFMNNWMNSPGHKANILSDKFTGIGVGVYKSGDKIYATQEFCA